MVFKFEAPSSSASIFLKFFFVLSLVAIFLISLVPFSTPYEKPAADARLEPRARTCRCHQPAPRRPRQTPPRRARLVLESLANASGVSRSMLSQIEREKANPTLAVTLRIARAFGLTLGELIEMPGAASSVTVIRANDHTYHYRSDKDCRIRTLSPLNLEKDVEFYEVRLQPGGALRSSPHFEGTREFLTLQKGRLRIESAKMPKNSATVIRPVTGPMSLMPSSTSARPNQSSSSSSFTADHPFLYGFNLLTFYLLYSLRHGNSLAETFG